MKQISEELMEKAKVTQSPEELLALARENGLEVTEEEAKQYFEWLHKAGEMQDDELENVAGGGCLTSDEKWCPNCRSRDVRQYLTVVYRRQNWYICNKCGATFYESY